MIYGIGAALFVLGVVLTAAPVRVLQRGGYRTREYRTGLTLAEYLPILIGAAVGVLAAYGLGFSGSGWRAGFGGAAIGIAIPIFSELFKKHVPELKFTARCKRLYLFLIPAEIAAAVCFCALAQATESAAWCGFLPAVQLGIVPLAAVCLAPSEKKKQRVFIDQAKLKLKKIAPTVIGVTGSYGKTSFKNALESILAVRFRVCASPASFNTPMGLCRTINERLLSDDEILIAEMGARYPGDLAELAAIAPPDVAVITGIGTQHLETFGSEEALKNAKYELVQGLLPGGAAFFAGDEGSCELSGREGERRYRIGDPPYAVVFSDIRVTEEGSSFTLETSEGSAAVKTVLIGAHQLENLRLACAVGRYFGLTAEELSRGCAAAKPTPHRLQLLPKRGNLQVIDDSYNASIEGIRAASDVLGMFSPPRAVITPGIVEAGQSADVANFRAGFLFGGVTEYAFVYGENARTLEKGLCAGGLAADRIRRVRSRNAAVKKLNAVPGLKVVLFSNDLPH